MYQVKIFSEKYGDLEEVDVATTFEGAVQKVFNSIGAGKRFKVDASLTETGGSLEITNGDVTVANVDLIDTTDAVSDEVAMACEALSSGDLASFANLFTVKNKVAAND